MSIRIAIGADHRGFALKEKLMNYTSLGAHTIAWQDVGSYSSERTDYPLFAQKVVQLIQQGIVDKGLLSCGSGIGMAIAANRFKGIYAGLVWNETIARLAKEDDNINVLIIPSDFITLEEALAISVVWLSAQFKGGRYEERLNMLDTITSIS